jgi:hypothetical protein
VTAGSADPGLVVAVDIGTTGVKAEVAAGRAMRSVDEQSGT